LTWEAVRRVPAGGVWTLTGDAQAAAALGQQATNLEPVERPVILTGAIIDLPSLIREAQNDADAAVAFDLIIGRNALTHLEDKAQAVQTLKSLLKPTGRLVLAEVVPNYTQRLHKLVDLSTLQPSLIDRIVTAEEAIYQNPNDPMINWNETSLTAIFDQAGFGHTDIRLEPAVAQVRVGAQQLERWFAETSAGHRPTFAQHLLTPATGTGLTSTELKTLKDSFAKQLTGQVVSWQSTIAYVLVRRA
ncbi:MAG: methyltransferase domain-containing protein, partial [Anaerolineae bacterium]|nr:methyltransferase domain-containing protein [Anaerolineae bacterium]